MRIIFRGLILFLVGLFAAIVLYPVLHEFGHAVFAFLSGVEIEEINLFSEFNVVCRVENSETIKAVFVGYGGIIAPVIFSLLFSSDIFIFRYINFTIKIINLLAVMNAVAALIMFTADIPVMKNDITAILTISNNSLCITVIFLILCIFLVIISLINKKNILDDFYSFFVE